MKNKEIKTKKLLEQALRDVEYYKGKFETVQNQLDKIKIDEREQARKLDDNFRNDLSVSEKLMEIIRWQTNPDTAKYPFSREKGQRDSEEDRGRRFIR